MTNENRETITQFVNEASSELPKAWTQNFSPNSDVEVGKGRFG